jgi:hypothetical protein
MEQKQIYLPWIPGEINTKEELFSIIRRLTREGYFFQIENFYQGGKADRAGYMIEVYEPKTPVGQ